MKYLVILNDPPYGTERSYNGLRLAMNLLKLGEGIELSVFLMADAVGCAKAGQKTPDGYYNLERMLKPIVRQGRVLLCGSCMDARGLREEEMAEGCRRSTLMEATACARPGLPGPEGGYSMWFGRCGWGPCGGGAGWGWMFGGGLKDEHGLPRL